MFINNYWQLLPGGGGARLRQVQGDAARLPAECFATQPEAVHENHLSHTLYVSVQRHAALKAGGS